MARKSLFTTLAVALTLFLGGSLSAQAQNPDLCKPDCPESEFGSTQTIIITFPDGCVVRVKYAYRQACNIWNDLGIISIEELTPPCWTYTTKQLLDLVTKELFIQNPMGFPVPVGPGPSGDTCFTHWRVVKGACWKDSIDCDEDTLHVPCGAACCLGSYEICAVDSVVVSVTPTGSYIFGECDTLDIECEPICDEEPSAAKGDDPDLGFNSPPHFHRSMGEAVVASEKSFLRKAPESPARERVASDPQQAMPNQPVTSHVLMKSDE